jgi:4-amino-4-deoxy-L-arabinose transferase-like glycosyltransferase
MNRKLAIAVAVGVAARVALIAGAWSVRGRDAFLVPDSHSYLRLADALARGEGFRNVQGLPEMFRTPGYPLLLALGSAIEHPVRFALALNLVLSAAVVVLTFVLARSVLRDERIAMICAFIAALEPTMLAWSAKVMPVTLLTFALLAFAVAALRAMETKERRWFVVAAIALCLAAYAKPIAYPLVILFCVLSLLRVRAAAVFVVVCVLLLAPWHVRNARHGYAGFSTLVARAAYLSAGASILAQREHRQYEDVRQELLRRGDVRGPTADPARYGREGWSLVASQPFAYAKTHARGMLRTMFDPGAAEYLRFFGLYEEGGRASMADHGMLSTARTYPLAFWSSVALAIMLAPLVLLPVLAIIRTRSGAMLLLAVLAGYLIAAGGGVPGYARFRVPAVPFLIVMSAMAKEALSRRSGRGCAKRG